jgi:Na+-driven multidrug efflux pump
VVFIPWLGMPGAALATALASFLYNFMLFIYVYRHFGLQPFSKGMIQVALLTLSLFLLFSQVPAFGQPWQNILMKGLVVSMLYGVVLYRTRVAPEIFDWLVARLFKKS